MTGALFLILVIHIIAVARVTRFVVFDDLIAEPRDWLVNKLTPKMPDPDDARLDEEIEWPPKGVVAYLRDKAVTLIECPWCVSIWVSAGTLWATYLFTDYTVIMPVFWWVGLSMVATALIDWTDGERNLKVRVGDE